MHHRNVLFSVYLSNALEFFDYTLFGSLSVIVHKNFFPESFSINAAIFTFCLSLIIRPIGGYLFGYVGDKIGRAVSLRLSILTMSCASLIVAICPPFESIGLWATGLIVLSRILQGISAGGEYNGAAIFAIETLKFFPFTISGYLTSSAIFGLFIAIWVAKFLTLNALPDYFWRFGFLFGSMIGVLSLYLRRQFPNQTPQENKQDKSSLTQKISSFFLIFFVGGQTGAIGYFLFIGLRPFLSKYGVEISVEWISVALLSASITCIMAGHLARFINPFFIFRAGIFSAGILFPFFIFLCAHHYLSTEITMILSGIFLGAHGSMQHGIFQQLSSSHSRQRFVSIAFSLGTGVISTFVILLMQNANSVHLLCFSFVSLASFLISITKGQFYEISYPRIRSLSPQGHASQF